MSKQKRPCPLCSGHPPLGHVCLACNDNGVVEVGPALALCEHGEEGECEACIEDHRWEMRAQRQQYEAGLL